MATVTLVQRNRTFSRAEEVRGFLRDNGGIEFERWEVGRLDRNLLQQPVLAPEEKEKVLQAFGPEIEALKARRSYRSADVVALAPETPNLEGILAPFAREHHHTEDEVRFIVGGSGVFSIRWQEAEHFDIRVSAEDLIVVPAGTWHWFNLTEKRSIKAIRLFQSPDGWKAIYRETVPAL